METVTRQVVRDALTCTKRHGNTTGGGGKTDPNDGTGKVSAETESERGVRVQVSPTVQKQSVSTKSFVSQTA